MSNRLYVGSLAMLATDEFVRAKLARVHVLVECIVVEDVRLGGPGPRSRW